MISQERMEKALTYLAETDEPLAKLKTDAERYEYVAKKVRSSIFLHSEGTVADRQASADVSEEYANAMRDYFRARNDSLAMENKRKTESLVYEAWRSINANRRLSQ